MTGFASHACLPEHLHRRDSRRRDLLHRDVRGGRRRQAAMGGRADRGRAWRIGRGSILVLPAARTDPLARPLQVDGPPPRRRRPSRQGQSGPDRAALPLPAGPAHGDSDRVRLCGHAAAALLSPRPGERLRMGQRHHARRRQARSGRDERARPEGMVGRAGARPSSSCCSSAGSDGRGNGRPEGLHYARSVTAGSRRSARATPDRTRARW